MALFIALISVVTMIISDLRLRKVSLYALLIFGSSILIHSCLESGLRICISNVMGNMLLLILMGLIGILWFYATGSPHKLKKSVGCGDIIFFAASSPLFQLYEYMIFMIASFAISLLWWLIMFFTTKRRTTIPLVATSGICCIAYICLLI